MRPVEVSPWDDLFQANDFVVRRAREWEEKGLVDRGRGDRIQMFLAGWQSEMETARQKGHPFPGDRYGLPRARPEESPASRSLRYWSFLAARVRTMRKEGLLTLSAGHAILDEVDGHRDALKRRLAVDELPMVVPAWENDEVPPPPPPPRRYLPPLPEPELVLPDVPRPPARPLLDVLLDPRNIQYLLVLGGALMTLGLVILLYINGLFESPVAVASALTGATGALLGLGWWLLLKTQHHTAGRAVTLLACLIMPLNLWYLHSNDLCRVEGSLWVPALAVVGLYAASAWVLRDEAFVHVLALGVAGAGLLMIAKAGHFWEVTAPASLLIVLGLACIHAERAFPDEQEGPFTRRRFGLAFFLAGHALLAVGLALVLGAFVSGRWLYPVFEPFYQRAGVGPSSIVGEKMWLALLLILAGAYAHVYSDLVVRHRGHHVVAAALCLAWAAAVAADLFLIQIGPNALIAILAAIGLGFNILNETALKGSRAARAFPVAGLLLPLGALAIGLWQYLRFVGILVPLGAEEPSWGYVLAMALTAVSLRAGAHLYRSSADGLAHLYFLGTAAATLVGAASLLTVLGIRTWEGSAHLIALIPMAYLVAAYLYRGGPAAEPLTRSALLVAGVLLLLSVSKLLQGVMADPGDPISLWLALFFVEMLAFYALASRLHGQGWGVGLATAFGCGAAWQLFVYSGTSLELMPLAFAVGGLAMLAAYRLDAFSDAATEVAFHAGNGLLTLGLAAAALLALSRLSLSQAGLSHAFLCLALALAALGAMWLVRERSWRRWYVTAAIGEGLLAFLAFTLASNLPLAEKARLFASLAGAVLLGAALVGRSREGEREDDQVTLGLFLGSLLLGIPQMLACVGGRMGGSPAWHDELAFLVVSVALLSVGFMMQLKATTVIGAFLCAAYVVTLLVFVPWSRMNAIAVALAIGGGALFGLGLVLSVFRDRLLALPERIRKREGVFKVLSWR
jgi:hypothetical protein